jgi:hypothetical protein
VVEPVVDEFGMDEEGRLDFFGSGEAVDGGPAGSPWDEEVDAGWDPSDHLDAWEDDGDGPEAWLRSLPPELRAEVEARPPVTVPPWEAGPAEARASFAGGGPGDAMLPGRVLEQLLAEATLDGYSQLSDDELAGVLRGWQRQVAHGQANLAGAVRALAGRRAAGSSRAAEHVADELAAELTLTGRSAARQLELAAGLDRLPEVTGALLSGFIDWPRACVFVDELAVVDDAAAGQISARLADPAAGWTTGQLRAALARAVLAADPSAAGRRKKQARKDTRVEVWREGSGNAALAGRELRLSSAIMLDKKLSSDAAWLAACGVPGSQEQLRSLAYTTLLSGRELASILEDPASWPGAQAAEDGGAQAGGAQDGGAQDGGADAGARGDGGADAGARGDGARPEPDDSRPARSSSSSSSSAPASPGQPGPAGSIHLTMPMSAFLGGSEPGEVAGYGPVDAATSRELAGLLAADPATRWCLTLTGPDGRAAGHACDRRGPAPGEPAITWAAGLRERLLVLESGTCRHARETAGYVPPPRLRHLVMVRQRRCCFPGCRRPARQCDLDHTIPHDKGGRTCECNLATLCRRHHRAKQAPGWHLAQDQPGHMTWRLPSSREYQTTGDPY